MKKDLLLLPVIIFLITGFAFALQHERGWSGLFASMTVALNYYRNK